MNTLQKHCFQASCPELYVKNAHEAPEAPRILDGYFIMLKTNELILPSFCPHTHSNECPRLHFETGRESNTGVCVALHLSQAAPPPANLATLRDAYTTHTEALWKTFWFGCQIIHRVDLKVTRSGDICGWNHGHHRGFTF